MTPRGIKKTSSLPTFSKGQATLVLKPNINIPLLKNLLKSEEKKISHEAKVAAGPNKVSESSKEDSQSKKRTGPVAERDAMIGQVIEMLKNCNETELAEILSKRHQKVQNDSIVADKPLLVSEIDPSIHNEDDIIKERKNNEAEVNGIVDFI
jgi:hypothetical protein